VNWEGRPRPFPEIFGNPASLPDLRVLAGIAEELGTPLGFRTVAEARAEMEQLGGWDGARASLDDAPVATPAEGDGVVLATWKQMLDNGTMQHGDEALRATARMTVARMSATMADALGPAVTITGDRGEHTLPVEVDDVVDGVVWVPANSAGRGVLADLASPGSRVGLKGANL
jgi:NADH-quinone oxidoreductase subunit G